MLNGVNVNPYYGRIGVDEYGPVVLSAERLNKLHEAGKIDDEHYTEMMTELCRPQIIKNDNINPYYGRIGVDEYGPVVLSTKRTNKLHKAGKIDDEHYTKMMTELCRPQTLKNNDGILA